MMFKTVLFGGFLFATLCAATDKPRTASLEVLPNLDQSLTYKDFRVHYSGAGNTPSGSTVSIKIYKKGDQEAIITHTIAQGQENTPKAYYFGKQDAKDGGYEVQVCADTDCSDKSPALTKMKDQTTGAVTCEKGQETDNDGVKVWSPNGKITLDVIGAEGLTEKDRMEKITQNPLFKSDWKKFGIKENPSYKQLDNGHVLYTVVDYDIAHYRELFVNKAVVTDTAESGSYAHEFCERKYLLSGHVHLINKATHEVKYRFKKTLYLSETGIQNYIIKNTKSKAERTKVPVELAFEDTIEAGKYDIWISICATEKDRNESTVCAEPLIHADFIIQA